MWKFLEPGYPFKETVIVNLKTGRSFRGVLWQRTGGFLVLKQAVMLRPREAPLPIDGDSLVPFGEIEFIQVVQPMQQGE